MRQLIATIFIFTAVAAFGQNNIYRTAGIPYTIGSPTFVPGAGGSMVAIDTVSGDWYYSMNRYTDDWIKLGDRVQSIAGCAAPAYTPVKYQSQLVVNSCATPELYLNTTGSTWVCLNCAASGATNLSWTQLTDSTYQLNSSTGSDVVLKVSGGATASLSGSTLTLSAGGGGTVQTDATLDGDGSGGDPLKIAQQSASSSEVLMWTGATWEPSWGNPYTFVTSGATITTAVNEVLIGTISANAIFGLPSCNAANDGKRFKFVRNGTDTTYSVTIDPSSTEQFYDGTLVKIFFGKLAIDCTCRYSGGTGVWFFDNF